MIVFFSLIFTFLGELGFLFILLFLSYFFLIKLLAGFLLGGSFNGDLLGTSIVFLTVLVFFFIVLSGSFDYFKSNSWIKFLCVLVFFLIFLMGVFLCSRFIVFYVLFEMAVLPIFIIIIGWGYRVNRVQSAVYMFLYTFLSSIPFLIFLLFFFLEGCSFFSSENFFLPELSCYGGFFWATFCLVFLVKLPVFFFHLWLPKAHVEAPLLGSMILAGVLLKLGGFGLYKILIFCSKDFIFLCSYMGGFFIVGGFITGLLCLRQTDLKSLIAYSSIVHMAPVVLGIFFIRCYGLMGGLIIMFSHGLCSACLFFILNLSYLRLNRRSYLLNRGGLLFSPYMSFLWLLFCVCNMGFPPSFNFFSELFIVIGVFSYGYVVSFFFFLIMLLRGFYRVMLYLYFNHGEKKFFLFCSLDSLKDLIVCFLSLFYLFSFIFYISLFMCLSKNF